MYQINDFKVNDKVRYTAGGMVARSEGVAGMLCTGKVVEVCSERTVGLVVMPDYRLPKDHVNYKMNAFVEMDNKSLKILKF